MGFFSRTSRVMKKALLFVVLDLVYARNYLVELHDSCPKGKPTPGTGCKAPLPNDCLYEDQAFDCIGGKWTRVLKEGDKCYFETICSQQDDLKCKTDPACGGVTWSYCRKSNFEVPKLNCTNRCTGCGPKLFLQPELLYKPVPEKPFMPAPVKEKCPKKKPTVGHSCIGILSLCIYENEVEEESDTVVECLDGKWALFKPGTGVI